MFNRSDFRAGATELADLIRKDNVGFLRIGADSGDLKPLTANGIRNIAALAQHSGAQVVLTLPLARNNPQIAQRQLASAQKALGGRLLAVEVGNEPDFYVIHHRRPASWGMSNHLAEVAAYERTFTPVQQRIPLWGPNTSDAAWLGSGSNPRFSALTVHHYPLTSCHGHQPTQRELTSPSVRGSERKFAETSMVRAPIAPVLVDLTNSVACGGYTGVSNVSASAFWAIDYGLTLAQAGISGVAFHEGLAPWGPTYSPLCFDTNPTGGLTGWSSAPEGRGINFLTRIGPGQFLTTATSGRDHNIRAYALRRPGGATRLVILNLDPLTITPVTVNLSIAPGPESTSPRGTAWHQISGISSLDYASLKLADLPETATPAPSTVVIAPGQALVLEHP